MQNKISSLFLEQEKNSHQRENKNQIQKQAAAHT